MRTLEASGGPAPRKVEMNTPFLPREIPCGSDTTDVLFADYLLDATTLFIDLQTLGEPYSPEYHHAMLPWLMRGYWFR